MLNKMLKMLTSALKTNANSNIGKIMIVFNEQHKQAMKMLEKIESWNDLENAKGKELDAIGAEVNQARGQATDVQYRMLIRSKRTRAKADGTLNSIIDTMSETLNCKPTDLRFKSVIENGGTEPNALVIELLPLKIMSDAKMTPLQVIKMVEQVASSDVRVASANFKGTFRFSNNYSEPEYNQSNGFDRGTWSIYLVPNDEIELPI